MVKARMVTRHGPAGGWIRHDQLGSEVLDSVALVSASAGAQPDSIRVDVTRPGASLTVKWRDGDTLRVDAELPLLTWILDRIGGLG